MIGKPRRLFPSVFLGAVLLWGCEADTIGGAPEVLEQVPFQPLDGGAGTVAVQLHSGIRDRRRMVIRDEASWGAAWSEAAAPYSPPPPLPGIDFSQETLILASMGEKGTSGYSIRIDAVYGYRDRYKVHITETAPARSCGVHNAITAPLTVVRIPRISGDVSFETALRVQGCD